MCVQAKRPYLGGAADEAIYGRKINNVARTPLPNEKTSVHDLYETLYDAVYRGSVRGYSVLGYPPPHTQAWLYVRGQGSKARDRIQGPTY